MLHPVSASSINAVLVEACLHPDLQTNLPYAKSAYDEFYFCSDPDQAIQRLMDWSRKIEAGTERLRTLPPQRFVTEAEPL